MSQITRPLDIKSLEAISQSIDSEGNIIFEVKSKHDHSTCHKCGQTRDKTEWARTNKKDPTPTDF
jgi:Fe2+ or Zn2+ uptake regulation protein